MTVSLGRNDTLALPREDGDIPHLAGQASAVRQVLAAHFLRNCPHVIEIGGHMNPITAYLTHHPRSVLSIDPKTPPCESDELNGRPCRVRHVARKFQQIAYPYAPFSYGLVLLGFSLKPFGVRESCGELLFHLVDNARVTVIDYSEGLDRAISQLPAILNRHGLETVCRIAMTLSDSAIDGTPHAKRQFVVLRPADGPVP